MASPMPGAEVCAICYEDHKGGTFDLEDDGSTVALVLANVCPTCRWWETRQLILSRAHA